MNLLGVNVLGQRDHAAAMDQLHRANQQAAGLFQPIPGKDVQQSVQNDAGSDITDAFGPQMTQGPARQRTPQEIAAGLAGLSNVPGFNMTPYKDLATFAKPEVKYDRGFGYDDATGAAAGAFHPDLDKGMALTPGGVVNLPGYTQAAAENAGAVTGAQEGAKAGFDVIPLQMPDGSTVQVPRDVAIKALLQQMAGGGNGTLGRAQSPAAQAADIETAKAGAAANAQLPQVLADAQQARDLIQVIKKNPEGPKRTGALSLLPAIPGTSGASFDAEHNQLQGKLFMQAYNGLRGGGQITEVEGRKATEAIGRLSRAQTWHDYNKALDDLDGVLGAGMQRAQQQPGRLQPQSNGARASSRCSRWRPTPSKPPAASGSPSSPTAPRTPCAWPTAGTSRTTRRAKPSGRASTPT
jgi:hypothetical protein